MYFVKYGDNYLHDPRNDGYMLLDLSLDCEDNSCGYCDFTIYPNHPLYGTLKERDADNLITVYDDKTLLFSGFIYELGKEFYLDGHVKCKGELDFLKESIVRPYSTVERGFGDTAPNTVNGYFEWLIEQHNKQSDDNKQFVIGINQGFNLDKNNYIYRENDTYPNTMDEINEKLLKEIGGYIRIRHENGIRYIDYLSEHTDSNLQILDFGVNLTDYTQTDDSANIATFVVPLGSKMSETGYEYDDGYFATSDTSVDPSKQYYIKTYNYQYCGAIDSFNSGIIYYEYNSNTHEYFITGDTTPVKTKKYYNYVFTGYSQCGNELTSFESGVTYYEYNYDNDESNLPLTIEGITDGNFGVSGCIHNKDYIYNIDAQKKYGWIGITYQNSDITTKEELRLMGAIALNKYISPKRTIEIKAVDMHFINPKLNPIQIGEYVRVRSVPHNLDSYFLCRSIDLDLNNPENSIYTLGTTVDTLTGEHNKIIDALNEAVDKQKEASDALTEEVKKNALKATTISNRVYISQEQTDAALCSLYEKSLSYQSETDDAICALYEMVSGGE